MHIVKLDYNMIAVPSWCQSKVEREVYKQHKFWLHNFIKQHTDFGSARFVTGLIICVRKNIH